MSEFVEPGILESPKKRRVLKLSDIIIFGILLIVIALLVVTLASKLRLRHDVAGARVVSDQAIADIQKRDGAAIYKLGTPKFQSNYTAKQLTAELNAIKMATLKAPTLDRQIVSKGSKGQTIFFIYKYSALKVPYYIGTALVEQSGHWKLTSFSGGADETALIPG